MPDVERKTLSATEVPALFDASPYITRWMLYRKFRHGDEIAQKESNRMDWGKRLEGPLLQAAAEDLRFEVRANRGDDGNQVYVRNGLLGCTRDATIICPDRGPGALEIKCVFDYQVWMREWGGGKTPPRQHEIQLQVQCKVGDGTTPYKWGVLGAFCGGEMFYFQRKPIPDLWAAMDAKAAEFFDDVKNDREPDPFGTPIEVPLLTQVFPTVAGKVLDLSKEPPEIPGEPFPIISEEWKRAIEQAERVRMMDYHGRERLGHEKAEKKIKAEMLALAGDAAEILFPHGVRVKIKKIERAGYTVAPSLYKTVSAYVPEGLDDGAL